MNRGAEKPLSADHEAEGDNPGVGGMPAEKSLSEEKTNSRADHEAEGDNPGVGGMPAEKSLSEEDQPGEPRRESTG